MGARVPAAVDGTITAAHPASIASTASADGTTRVDQWDERHREQALVLGAEVGHGLVLRRTARVEAVLVLADEPCRGKGGEHELTLDTEEVQYPAPFRRVEGPHGVPTLVPQQTLLGQFRHLGVRMPRLGLGDGIGEHAVEDFARHVAQPVLERRVDEVVEEVSELHHVAVGVKDASIAHIGRRLHRVHCAHQPFSSVTKCH